MNIFPRIVLLQKVLLVSTFCFLLLQVRAQDSLFQKKQHVIGIGAQLMMDRSKRKEHDVGEIKYNGPGRLLFYRLIIPKSSRTCLVLNSNFYYRTGQGYSSSGGKGGGVSCRGNFESYRLDIGVAKRWQLGKKAGPNIMFGGNIGALAYSKGSAICTEFSVYYKTVEKVEKPVRSKLSSINLSVNFEIDQVIPISAFSSLLLGLRFQVETPEGFGAPLGVNETFFIGYVFR